MRKVLPDTTSLSKEARPHYPNIEKLDIGTQPPQSSQTSTQTEQPSQRSAVGTQTERTEKNAEIPST